VNKYIRLLSSTIITGLGFLTLTGTCGGGGDSSRRGSCAESSSTPASPPPAAIETKGVISGYTGSLDWTVADSAGPGGGVGGGDGAGGVGIGGALGQFRNVSVSVRSMNGGLIGRANVGADGLVTFRTGGDSGPFLIEVEGQAGGEYFDEGKGAYIAFGLGESLRSYVDAVDKNLGVTFATEAVYQYLAAAGFSVPANPPTAKVINDASIVIRDAINAKVDPKYALTDLKRLPALIGPTTGSNSLPDNPRGLYGILAAGFAKQAASFNPTLTSPGLESARQFASDLTDGIINGKNGKGVAVAEASRLTYDPSTLKQELSTATASAAVQYGVPQTQLPKASKIDLGFYRFTSNYADFIIADLLSDGTVTANYFNGHIPVSTETIATGASSLFELGANSMLIRFADGSAAVLGFNAHGELGVGDRLPRSTPTKVASLNAVTSVAHGSLHAIARLADGSVVTSGNNTRNQLGLESTVLPSSNVFVKVNAIGSAVSVAATSDSSFAVLSDGSVLAWGADSGGSLGNGTPASTPQLPKPVLIASNTQLNSVISLEAKSGGIAALRTDGSVFGWGSSLSGIIPGSSSNTYFAKSIPGLPSISKLGSDYGVFYALDRNGSVWTWGYQLASISRFSELPQIIDLTRTAFGTIAVAADGRRFRLNGFMSPIELN
jgi:hypothetical protein